MELQLLSVPYDAGVPDVRMGLGPRRLLDAGLESHLTQAGHQVHSEVLNVPRDQLTPEPRFAFELAELLADRVREAEARGRFPLILAGTCYSSIGTIAGLGSVGVGVLWFDCHADFNTPDSTVTGFLDGMPVAILTGHCWRELANSVPGFQPVPEENVFLLGVRDVDRPESARLEASRIRCLTPQRVRSALRSELAALRDRVEDVYLHLDLDVLDPSEGRANALAAPDGLTLSALREAVRLIAELFRVRAVAVSAYDPSFDEGGSVCRAAFDLLDTVVGS